MYQLCLILNVYLFQNTSDESKQTFQIGTVTPFFAGKALASYRGNYVHQHHASARPWAPVTSPPNLEAAVICDKYIFLLTTVVVGLCSQSDSFIWYYNYC